MKLTLNRLSHNFDFMAISFTSLNWKYKEFTIAHIYSIIKVTNGRQCKKKYLKPVSRALWGIFRIYLSWSIRLKTNRYF